MQKLTKTEEEVMQIIWILGPCTVKQILDHLEHEKRIKRPPHSSVSSIVRIIEEKGFLSHKAYGRTYEYFPIVKKEDYSKRSLKQFVHDYFDGSMSGLVSFLVKEKDISLSELDELMNKLK